MNNIQRLILFLSVSAWTIVADRQAHSLADLSGTQLSTETTFLSDEQRSAQKTLLSLFDNPHAIENISFTIQISRGELHDEKIWKKIVQRSVAAALASTQNSFDVNHLLNESGALISTINAESPHGIQTEGSIKIVTHSDDELLLDI